MKRHLLAAMISLVVLQTACSYKESSSQATVSPAPAAEMMSQDKPNIAETKDNQAAVISSSKLEKTAEVYQVQTAKKAMMVKERAVHRSLMAGNIAMSPPVAIE